MSSPLSKILWLPCLFLVLILATAACAGDAQLADTVTVFRCAFGEDWDVNYDRWPDRWVRKTGGDYPYYVNIQIDDGPDAPGGKCLAIDLDGSAAAVASPPIRVISRFGYLFDADLKNDGLDHSVVIISLDFCDKTGHVLQTTHSESIATTKGWHHIQLGPIEPGDPATDRVVIRLQVERGGKGDLKGRVALANVQLSRLPRIAVSTNSPCNVYPQLDDVVVQCALSGIHERNPVIRFQLFDATDKECDSGVFKMDGHRINDEEQRPADILDGIGHAPAGYEGSAEWRPKVPDFGFYRVEVKMQRSAAEGEAQTPHELYGSTMWLAVVPPLPMPRIGEFGWTLPEGEDPLSFQELSRLLPQVGINWVKVPAWFEATDPRRGDDIVRFVELLGASNIDVVGVIDRPPANSDLAKRLGRDTPIADVLSLDATTWSAALEPVMTRLSLRVRWWQLGRDDDPSFAGFAGLKKRIDELRTQLFRFGQDVRMGMTWDWESALANKGKVTWDFEQLRWDSPPTEAEFMAKLASPRSDSALRWVLIDPPARSTEANQTTAAALSSRCTEFVRRLVAAKQYGADAIIISKPFDDDAGLMHANGMPGELLLPWRTTASMLGGAEFLGQLDLPTGSENRLFLRPDGQVVMVVWSEQPTQEVLFLGNDVKCIDIWGRATTPPTKGKEQLIDVGPQPTFVLGLNEAIARWRMSVAFEHMQVPSIFAKPHPNSLGFKNFFKQGVGGTLRIVVQQDESVDEHAAATEEKTPEQSALMPDRWNIEPPQRTFQLASNEELKFPFDIRLKNAFYGKQPVRIDFNVEADEPYQFSVYRQMEVGTTDLTLNVKSHLDKDGSLIVEQFMTNSATGLADFRCYLYAKGHRRQRMQVYRLGPTVDRKVYRYPDGQELVGQELLLEIEELNGPRVLKYRFMAAEKSDGPVTDDAPFANDPKDTTATTLMRGTLAEPHASEREPLVKPTL